ncbi:MAG: hypothetical protein ACLSA6_12950 [Holdemania massiliensis]
MVCQYVGMRQDGELCGAAMILFRSLPMGMKLAYIPCGPSWITPLRTDGIFLIVHSQVLCKPRSRGM